MRQLGIPTVLDRLIQQALHQVMQPLFDPDFSERSYGFRPGRSAHQAVRQAREYVARRAALGGGHGPGEVLRPGEPRHPDGAGGPEGQGQAGAAADSALPASGHDGRWAGDARGRKGRRKAGRSRRCCRTSCWTTWTRNWNDGVMRSAATRTTATSTCGRRRAGERVMASVTRFLEERLKLKVNRGKERGGPALEAEVSGLQHDAAPRSRG